MAEYHFIYFFGGLLSVTLIIHDILLFDSVRIHDVDVRARILIQVTIYRRLLIGRDGHLDQSEAYDIS